MDGVTIKVASLNMTEDEFFDFCRENILYKIERDKDGNIYIMEPSGFESENFSAEISRKIGNWNEDTDSGKVVSSNAGFVLPSSALRSPDAAWISNEILQSIPKSQRQKFLHACPNFVVEVKSPSDSLHVLKEKMKEWIENGCQLAWLVVPEDEITFIYKKDTEVRVKQFTELLSGEDVLIGFNLDLSKLIK